MISASLLFAAALAVWGPVAPAGASESEPSHEAAAPATAAVPPPAPPPPVARMPLDRSAAPALLEAPAPSPPRTPLYKRWQFWLIAGGAFATAVGMTIAVTRPGPAPYSGNAPPYIISIH